MSGSTQVAYNPNDPIQQSFLSSLALGETGNSNFAATEGVGGTNLSGLPTDQYGFPSWSGQGNSHAAGIFQFQPGTWDAVAQEFGLNFSNPADQAAGAWYTAQQAYQQKTGGDLETDLQAGKYSSVQSALAAIWPSVTGNAANPQGLANALATGVGAAIPGAAQAAPTSASQGQQGTGIFGTIENWFLRGGLIFIGAIVILVSLYFLLSREGYIPKASSVAKTALA